MMKLGVSVPSTDIGGDPVVQKDFAQAVEAMGFDHLAAYDHVVGVSPESQPDWTGPCASRDCFHDPFALFGFLAAHTSKIGLSTHILILTQRQTALVARQAASVDVLSGGRLRLGIGIGWNRVEFTVLGENFGNRGTRSLEQIEVLQALWMKPYVCFEGR
jgi:alkanesulfonate monooxygenase SsuD/methylene tetrahydromethanopterin reductase-like flavin-dependent oxidoreductase (luciferase family)